MASPYFTSISTTNFICAGIARDFENVPPIFLFGLLRSLLALALTLSLSLALLLSLPPLSLSLPLGLALLRFIPSSLSRVAYERRLAAGRRTRSHSARADDFTRCAMIGADFRPDWGRSLIRRRVQAFEQKPS